MGDIHSVNYNDQQRQMLVQSHGAVMAFTWTAIASNAIILARYYRRLAPSKHMCGYPVWFPMHFFCALCCGLFSLAAFIVILAEKNFYWTSSNINVNFVHSILGVVGIGLCGVQFLYSMCRPSLGSSMRDLFNTLHRTIGVLAFLFSTAALCSALFIQRIGLGWIEVGIIMGWLVWLFLVFFVLEILKFFDNKYLMKVPFPDTYPNEIHNRFDTIRLILLVLHLIASIGVGTAMIVFIVQAPVVRWNQIA